MSKLVYLTTHYTHESRAYTRHLCNRVDLPLCGVKSSFSYSYEDGESDCLRCRKAIRKIKHQIAMNLFHDQMYQYPLSSGQRYLIARISRWCGILPDYLTRNFYKLGSPFGAWQLFEKTEDALQRMDEIAPLSQWTLEPESAPLTDDEIEDWMNRED